jgi:hypothetical protein
MTKSASELDHQVHRQVIHIQVIRDIQDIAILIVILTQSKQRLLRETIEKNCEESLKYRCEVDSISVSCQEMVNRYPSDDFEWNEVCHTLD